MVYFYLKQKPLIHIYQLKYHISEIRQQFLVHVLNIYDRNSTITDIIFKEMYTHIIFRGFGITPKEKQLGNVNQNVKSQVFWRRYSFLCLYFSNKNVCSLKNEIVVTKNNINTFTSLLYIMQVHMEAGLYVINTTLYFRNIWKKN